MISFCFFPRLFCHATFRIAFSPPGALGLFFLFIPLPLEALPFLFVLLARIPRSLVGRHLPTKRVLHLDDFDVVLSDANEERVRP